MKDRHALAQLTAADPRAAPESFDYYEVPAAVLCAFCGQADCEGCGADDDDASGVIAIVPWERHDTHVWQRLWTTARTTTQGADPFFAALPQGPIGPALRFAVLSESLAVVSMAGMLLGVAALAFPGLALHVALEPSLRAEVLRWLALGLPAVTLWMVVVHAVHGLAIDGGARRQGAAPQRRRALRFGLYACGWDLMTSPLGALVTLFSDGLRAALALGGAAMNVPGRATNALLRGIYHLDEWRSARARRRGLWLTMLLVIVTAIVVVGAMLLA